MKDQWVGFVTQIRPHVESLTSKTIELYHASKDSIQPHVVKIQEVVDPHFQVCLSEILILITGCG